MRLRQQARLFIALPLLLGGVLLAIMLWSARQDQEHQAHFSLIQELALGSHELARLGVEITARPADARIHRQWWDVHGRLGQLLPALADMDALDILERIRREHHGLGHRFRQWQEHPEPAGETSARQQLAGELAWQARDLATLAGVLMRDHHREQLDLRTRVDYLAHGLVLALTLVLAALAAHSGLGLIRRLETLGRGTERIGAGHLEHRIDDRREDELGEFARSFDAMATHLGRVTASRDELEAARDALGQANAELCRYRDGLEVQVASRTAELALARDRAEAASRAKSVFLANMSHELRTPLNAILGYARMLATDGLAAGEAQRALAGIEIGGRQLLALINDILEITRIESGRLEHHRSAFDPADLLADLGRELAPRARAKGLDLRLDLDPALPRCLVSDEDKLRQVLRNLLENAVKFTRTGQVGLAIRLDPGGQGNHVQFRIWDTGPGIPEADRERIFLPFQQSELGIRLGEGTGLGLAISREYVGLMGGTLVLEPQRPEGGTCFSFSLDLLSAEPGACGVQRGKVSAEAETGAEAPDLSGLPPALLSRLEQAATLLDLEETRDAIREIAIQDPNLARRLEALCEGFDFAALVTTCRAEGPAQAPAAGGDVCPGTLPAASQARNSPAGMGGL